MKPKTLILAATALAACAATAAWLLPPKEALMTPVAPAKGTVITKGAALADEYFAQVKVGNFKEALKLYDPALPMKAGDPWPELIEGIAQAVGPVKDASLLRTTEMPHNADTCQWLEYAVTRAQGRWHENLMICPGAAAGSQVIAGHQVVNLDNNDPIGIGNLLTVGGVVEDPAAVPAGEPQPAPATPQ